MTSILRLPALIIRREQRVPCLHERAFRLTSNRGDGQSKTRSLLSECRKHNRDLNARPKFDQRKVASPVLLLWE
jgi:hypothetical protein